MLCGSLCVLAACDSSPTSCCQEVDIERLYGNNTSSALCHPVQGCQGIDAEMLRGGMRGGQLVEACGESGEQGRQGWQGTLSGTLRAGVHADVMRAGLCRLAYSLCGDLAGGHVARHWCPTACRGVDLCLGFACRALPCAACCWPLQTEQTGSRSCPRWRCLPLNEPRAEPAWARRTGGTHPLPARAASGKTQLCLGAAVQAARLGKRVVFIDTSNSLRAGRLRQVAQAQAAAAGAAEVGQDVFERSLTPPQSTACRRLPYREAQLCVLGCLMRAWLPCLPVKGFAGSPLPGSPAAGRTCL